MFILSTQPSNETSPLVDELFRHTKAPGEVNHSTGSKPIEWHDESSWLLLFWSERKIDFSSVTSHEPRREWLIGGIFLDSCVILHFFSTRFLLLLFVGHLSLPKTFARETGRYQDFCEEISCITSKTCLGAKWFFDWRYSLEMKLRLVKAKPSRRRLIGNVSTFLNLATSNCNCHFMLRIKMMALPAILFNYRLG